jgi:hypothetical protein
MLLKNTEKRTDSIENLRSYAKKFTEEEMFCFAGIMFAMTVCPMCNMKEDLNVEDDGLMFASRFF